MSFNKELGHYLVLGATVAGLAGQVLPAKAESRTADSPVSVVGATDISPLVERIAKIDEARIIPLPIVANETVSRFIQPDISLSQVIVDGARLRENPGLNGQVVVPLAVNTVLENLEQDPPNEQPIDGYEWDKVQVIAFPEKLRESAPAGYIAEELKVPFNPTEEQFSALSPYQQEVLQPVFYREPDLLAGIPVSDGNVFTQLVTGIGGQDTQIQTAIAAWNIGQTPQEFAQTYAENPVQALQYLISVNAYNYFVNQTQGGSQQSAALIPANPFGRSSDKDIGFITVPQTDGRLIMINFAVGDYYYATLLSRKQSEDGQISFMVDGSMALNALQVDNLLKDQKDLVAGLAQLDSNGDSYEETAGDVLVLKPDGGAGQLAAGFLTSTQQLVAIKALQEDDRDIRYEFIPQFTLTDETRKALAVPEEMDLVWKVQKEVNGYRVDIIDTSGAVVGFSHYLQQENRWEEVRVEEKPLQYNNDFLADMLKTKPLKRFETEPFKFDSYTETSDTKILIPIGNEHGFSEPDARSIMNAYDFFLNNSPSFSEFIKQIRLRGVINYDYPPERANILASPNYKAWFNPERDQAFIGTDGEFQVTDEGKATWGNIYFIQIDFPTVQRWAAGIDANHMNEVTQGVFLAILMHEGSRISNASSSSAAGLQDDPTEKEETLLQAIYEDLRANNITINPYMQRGLDAVFTHLQNFE